jgi:hypothetical protein
MPHNDPNILAELSQRARARRERDCEVTVTHNVSPGGIAYPNYRSQAMITYAYSARTGHYYVGYSGSSGGIVDRHQDLANHDMAWRRHGRIEGDIERYNDQYQGRSAYNCGEAAAYSIAVSWQERLSDLVFASFGTSHQLVDPCQNCMHWLQPAYGYYFNLGAWYSA